MGKFWEEIPDDNDMIQWIKEQKLFHVASAPLNGEWYLQALYKLD